MRPNGKKDIIFERWSLVAVVATVAGWSLISFFGRWLVAGFNCVFELEMRTDHKNIKIHSNVTIDKVRY